MKKSDKIVGLVSSVIILLTIAYFIKSRSIFSTEPDLLRLFGILYGICLLIALNALLSLGLAVRKRIKSFSKMAKKYSLKHTFTTSLFFIPYGKINTLEGKINGKTIEITDIIFEQTTQSAVNVAASKGASARVGGTRIYLDGENTTPNYSPKGIFYENPFLPISTIESRLSKLFE